MPVKKPYEIDIYRFDGEFTKDAPLGERSWFRCGGRADMLFEPDSQDDLAYFIKNYPADEPLAVLGSMANVIVRDGGVRGCVIQLGKPFAEIQVMGTKILAGASALNGSVASAAAKAGIGGLEFLSGIPGTVGGALRMNAGAYGAEVKDVLVGAMALSRDGGFLPLLPEDLKMSYRKCEMANVSVFLGGVFQGKLEDKSVVKKRLKDIKATRRKTQPISEKTGGSTFANPTDEVLNAAGLEAGLKAWQLVERVGGKDLQIGGARMSDKHLNFMINSGNATATDLENLGNELIKRVLADCGLELHWEIKRIGERV